MKYGAWITMFVMAALAALVLTGNGPLQTGWDATSIALAEDGETPTKKPGGLPPLKIDRGSPLLLEEGPKKPAKKPIGNVADNSACFCCHTNYEEESLAVGHANENVGCVECHGKSYEHRDDEDNITPPDVMYWPEKIDPKCGECHEEHDAPAKKVIARWQERCPEKTDPSGLVCTDCHGQHRLKFRTVWWDKKTRKLTVRKEGERIKMRAGLDKDGNPATKQTTPDDGAETMQ